MAYEFDVNNYLAEDPDDREPIHTAEINGATMRFFASKAKTVDLPWIPARDIGAICGFDRETTSLMVLAAVDKWSKADIPRVIKIGGKKEIVFPYLAAMALLMQISEIEDDNLVFDGSLLPQFYEAGAAATREIVLPHAPTAGIAFELTLVATRNAVAPPGFNMEIGTRAINDDGEDADDEPDAPDPQPKAPEYA